MKPNPQQARQPLKMADAAAPAHPLAPLLVETKEAAAILGLSVSTLEKWRFFNTPGTPRVVRIGRACRYRLVDLREWVAHLDEARPGPTADDH